MSRRFGFTVVVCAGIVAGSANNVENLCFNGSFDHSDPLEGWTYDYQWLNNKHYMDNHKKVFAEASGGGRSRVVRLTSTNDAGAKIECKPIPFELGYHYTCRLKAKLDGSMARLYFAGYKWKPGIRPYADPPIADLRTIYKSKAHTTIGKSWQTITLEIPGVKVTPLAYKHMKVIRFITLYAWTVGELHLDDVVITRVKDSSFNKM